MHRTDHSRFRKRHDFVPDFSHAERRTVGSGVVFSWAYALVRDTAGILLDRSPASSDLPYEIRHTLESDGDSLVTDLHGWQVGIGKYAAMVSVVAHEPKSCESYRALVRGHHEPVHVTIETQHCRENGASARPE